MRPESSFRAQVLDRSVKSHDHPNAWLAAERLHSLQMVHSEFFRIFETGKTVCYVVFLPLEVTPRVYYGEIPAEILYRAEFFCIGNEGRARRPARPGSRQARGKDDPYSSNLLPENIITRFPNERWLDWRGPSGNDWLATMQPFAIWPPKKEWAANDQPLHMVLSRAQPVPQAHMNRRENLLDLFSILRELNRDLRAMGRRLFRGAVNGWYYSDSPEAPKGGASEPLAHAQLVRFPFPIERAAVRLAGVLSKVTISTLADGWGTGIVLEANEGHVTELAAVLEDTLHSITAKGHSFNIVVAPTNESRLVAFVADRPASVPEPHFTNEWAFSEFGRAVVIDSPANLFALTKGQQDSLDALDPAQFADWIRTERTLGGLDLIRPDLRHSVIASLRMVCASHSEIEDIIQKLR